MYFFDFVLLSLDLVVAAAPAAGAAGATEAGAPGVAPGPTLGENVSNVKEKKPLRLKHRLKI